MYMYIWVDDNFASLAWWRCGLNVSCLVEEGKPATTGPGDDFFHHEQPDKPASAAPKIKARAGSSHLQHNKLYQMTVELRYQIMCGSR